ncbi:putative ankyrin-repeat protein [Vanrija albida]|uniref:Ankyrin-repeat protein n=1 Tax=Vanrija albida TaxID=181172 RepID=A0ABR3Q859_9TREE
MVTATATATPSASGSGSGSRAKIPDLPAALRTAVLHADVERVAHLAELRGAEASALDAEVAALKDDDGWGIVGMAIQASCGQPDREETVRLVVARWGVNAGPNGGRDKNGWTPLHLAALLSSPHIVSALLNRGADPAAPTDAGLTPYDLIVEMEGRESLVLLLDPCPTPTPSHEGEVEEQRPRNAKAVSAERRALLERRRVRLATRAARADRKAGRARLAAERERWVRERAKLIGVDPNFIYPPDAAPKRKDEPGIMGEDEDEDEPMDTDDEGDGPLGPAEHLVFSRFQLDTIYEIFINSYRPTCQPVEKRSLPANALFLYMRFAFYQCDIEWLEELYEGAIERVESGVYGNGDDLAFLAFWEYNLTLLLYLVRSDPELCEACERLSLLSMTEELIGAIHVFIIRIAERKIDDIMDQAMLDFESLEDFDDVRFADEWNLFRSPFGAKKKEAKSTLGSTVFNVPDSSDGRVDLDWAHRRSHSKGQRSLTRQSISDLKAVANNAKADAKEAIANGIASAQAVFGDKPNPRRISDILNCVIVILQLYEVNPAFVVQVFSQVFYWISSELFNRIITRKKYLCRTKALQIRMNITALEDFTRNNGLPPAIASRHLEPVMQLLQWLQFSSQINQFDTLIATVQGLRRLNPLQMRRAVQNYRFEVNESHMADDCMQYLLQLQRDWDRQRMNIGAKQLQAQRGHATDDATGSSEMSIDDLFDDGIALSEWIPQTAPESLGELLDSRFMLPFLVPSAVEHLLATPPRDATYRNFVSELALLPDGSVATRPTSRASHSSSRPLGWKAPKDHVVRELPNDFFDWLKARHSEVQPRFRPHHGRQAEPDKQQVTELQAEKALPPAPASGPVAAIQRALDPLKTMVAPSLAPLTEDQEVTPLATDRRPAAILGEKPLPSQPTQPLYETPFDSTPFQTPPKSAVPAHVARIATEGMPLQEGDATMSPDNIELQVRNALSGDTPNGSSPRHYELARHRRARSSGSISSVISSTGSSGSPSTEKKKWWKVGRKPSEESFDMVVRRKREDTAETIVPERGEREDTPTAPTGPNGMTRSTSGHWTVSEGWR